MNTSVEAAMHVHRHNRFIMTFLKYNSGLYYYNAGTNSNNNSNSTITFKIAYLFSTPLITIKPNTHSAKLMEQI